MEETACDALTGRRCRTCTGVADVSRLTASTGPSRRSAASSDRRDRRERTWRIVNIARRHGVDRAIRAENRDVTRNELPSPPASGVQPRTIPGCRTQRTRADPS
jgi:hypothetical protein